MPNGWEWGILVVIALLLFAGSRLSGVGSNVGRSIREFKDEIAASPNPGTIEPPPAGEPSKSTIVAESSGLNVMAESDEFNVVAESSGLNVMAESTEPNTVAELSTAGAPEASAEATSDSDPV
jgi:TatA/E family protein of Tat protein translocase